MTRMGTILRTTAATLAATVAAITLNAPVALANEATLKNAIEKLVVKSETNSGYDRSKFKHWIDANGDCQNTRAEVLVQESQVAVTYTSSSKCYVKKGKWFSYYDKKTWTNPSDVDIDHLVPLAEAWGSGAKSWNSDTRKRFANDLGDKRALVAVTDDVNQAKGAKDPAQWLPRYYKCKYIKQWVAVKLRWKLTVDSAEKSKLKSIAAGCTNTTIKWTPAKIVKA